MDYLMDTFTRAPSQVLVKSSQTFGEEAARMMTTAMEESLRTAAEQINSSVRETGDTMVHTMERSTERLADTVQDTGIQAFEEWGMSIERAFTEVGRHTESGILKGTRHACRTLDSTLRSSFNTMGDAMERSAIVASQNLRSMGSEQIPLFRRTFRREITAICAAICILSVSALIASLAFAVNSGLLSFVFALLFHRSFILTVFCAAIAHILHLWTSSPSSTVFDNPKTVFGVVASVAFVCGNIARDAVMHSTANTAVLLLVMGTATMLMYGVGLQRVWDIAGNIVSVWHEFREFRRQRRRSFNKDKNNSNNNEKDNENNEEEEEEEEEEDMSDSSSDDDNDDNNNNNYRSKANGNNTVDDHIQNKEQNIDEQNKHNSRASSSSSSKSSSKLKKKTSFSGTEERSYPREYHKRNRREDPSRRRRGNEDKTDRTGETYSTPRTDFQPNALHSSLSASKTLPATRHQQQQHHQHYKKNEG